MRLVDLRAAMSRTRVGPARLSRNNPPDKSVHMEVRGQLTRAA
jgi:hypothetical protein